MRQLKSLCENKDYFYSTQITSFLALRNIFFDSDREEILAFLSSSLKTQQQNIINTILVVL